jgi:outer membrane usher protein
MRSRRDPAPVALSPLAAAEGGNEVLGSAAFLALAAGQPTAPAAPVNGPAPVDAAPTPIKINPTKRTLRFIVPVTDGQTYLGDVTLAVAPDDSLSVQADRLLQMLEPILKPEVFAHLKMAVGAKAEISATELAAEHITLAYDSEKLALAIAIPVDVRRSESMSLRSEAMMGQETLEPAKFSGFVNFRSAMDFVEHGEDRGILAPVSAIDGAIRLAGVVAEGEGDVSFRKDEPTFRRTGSRLVYDDLKHVVRFTLGDVQPFATSFQSTPTVAGISAQRFYNILEPWREIRSTGSQSFTLFAPSMVETVVNGRSVERKLLQPGNYTLQDFPLAEGANNVRLVIQDEAGKQRVVDFDLYSNQHLIEPGATEFSAFAGVYSTPTSTGIDYSRHWAVFGFVRRGISQQFSAGVNLQADAQAQQVGGEIVFGTDFGLFGVNLSGSRRTEGNAGYAGAVTFEKIIESFDLQRSLSVHAEVETRSPHFATPGALLLREPLAVRAALGFALSLGRDTYVSADAQYSRERLPKDQIYSVRLSGGLSISDTMSVIGDLEWDKSRQRKDGIVRIGIRKRLGLRGQVQADVDNHGAVHTSYQASNGVGIGSWSTGVDVDRTSDGINLNAQGTLLTNRFELGVSQFGGYQMDGHNISDMRTTLRAGTSIAFADGAFALGRPIQQAFLIAAPHRTLHGKDVIVDPQQKTEQARSGTLGDALDGDLSAYSPRTLIYDVPDAPPGYDLGAGNVQITPPYKGGYRLEVGSDYHLLVIGRLLDRNGEPVSLLAGKAIDLKAPKRPAITMFTSRGGKFGAQGLRPGKWRIEMPADSGPLIYEIDVKDDPSGTVRLGDLRPEGPGGAQ